MIHKEKAIELVDKFVGFKIRPYNDPEMSSTLYKAKKHALICVDEIFPNIDKHCDELYFYWQQVKEEINKL